MSSSDGARRHLPDRPSSEHLRKQAKRLARRLHLQLAVAQRQLADEYGFADWAALMAHVRGLTPARPLPPLAAAARAGDVARVERLIAEGQDPNEGGDASRAAPRPLFRHQIRLPKRNRRRLRIQAPSTLPHPAGMEGRSIKVPRNILTR